MDLEEVPTETAGASAAGRGPLPRHDGRGTHTHTHVISTVPTPKTRSEAEVIDYRRNASVYSVSQAASSAGQCRGLVYKIIDRPLSCGNWRLPTLRDVQKGGRSKAYMARRLGLLQQLDRAAHSGPETGEGGQNYGHVSTSRVVK